MIRRLRCLMRLRRDADRRASLRRRPRARPRSSAWCRPAASRPGWCASRRCRWSRSNFAFVGGASQDPADKPGVGYMVVVAARRRRRRTRRQGVPRSGSRTTPIELRFSVEPRLIPRLDPRCCSEPQEESFDLLRLALTEPRFDADAVERMREQILAGLRRETTDPEQHRQPALVARRRFPDHPYGRPTNGTLNSVPTITADDLRDLCHAACSRATR